MPRVATLTRPDAWLWFGLAALVALRLIATLIPWAGLWGTHQQAYVAPWMAWAPWLLSALVLLPPLAAPVARWLSAMAEAVARAPGWLVPLLAVTASAIVLTFPDRLFYVGDFLLRMGAIRTEESPSVLSPQAFPLDVYLHYTLPLKAVAAKWVDHAGAARAIGALDAALLACASILLARAAANGAAARAAAFAVAFFGGYLCLMTGESKAFAEMVALAIAFAGFSMTALRSIVGGEGAASARRAAPALAGAGLCLGVGVFLHRLTLGMVPAWLLLVVLWFRAGGTGALRSPHAIIGLVAPIACLGVMAPRLGRTTLAYDIGANFATPAVGGVPGVLGAAFAPAHLLDVLNLLLFLSPLALVALPLLFVARGRASGSAAEAWWIALLATPYALVMLLLQPPQGPLRDWEAYAPSAAALSAAAAWAIARTIEGSGKTWLAAAVAVGVMAPTIQWLAHYSNRQDGLARLEVVMAGPPERSAVDRATTWNFIGWRRLRGEDYDRAAHAFEQAVDAAPSPRHLTDWAMAETMRGDHARAFELYREAVTRDPNYRLAWFGVGVSAINAGHPEDAIPAVAALQRLEPDNPKTHELAEWVRGWQAAGGEAARPND